MTDEDAVLAVNLEFYGAFAGRDVAAMDRLWPRHAPVACIHPGWAALGDRRSVMESWGEILSNPEAPRIECHDEEVALLGDVAIVLCEEVLPSATLAATNLFVKEDGGWRLIHHQASPVFAAGRTRRRRRGGIRARRDP